MEWLLRIKEYCMTFFSLKRGQFSVQLTDWAFKKNEEWIHRKVSESPHLSVLNFNTQLALFLVFLVIQFKKIVTKRTKATFLSEFCRVSLCVSCDLCRLSCSSMSSPRVAYTCRVISEITLRYNLCLNIKVLFKFEQNIETNLCLENRQVARICCSKLRFFEWS